VKIRWSAFDGAGFDYYKVVRSTDSTVSWPLGPGDHLVAAIGDPGQTWAWDGGAAPDTYWYRVFAVRSAEGGYVVLARSVAVKVVVPAARRRTRSPCPSRRPSTRTAWASRGRPAEATSSTTTRWSARPPIRRRPGRSTTARS
jgi:hypothetical protein